MSEFNTTMFRMLGERLKQIRLDNKLNQEDVARQIGLNRASISNIEVGRHQAPLSVLYEMSKLYKTDIQLLLPGYYEIVARINENNKKVNDLLDNMSMSQEMRSSIQKVLDNLEK
jgi:transcriptional regulator with XRE-family HTH domain